MNDEEVTLKRYQNLFRIAVRAFYDEMAVVLVDYMVLNCKASMTETQFETILKLPMKKVRASFQKMKDDDIILENVHQKRWTLTSNIKELLQARLAFIKVKLAEKIASTSVKKYYCDYCKKQVPAHVMAFYQGKCPDCKNDLVEMEKDIDVSVKLKELIQKIEETYIEKCKGREFPAKLYPDEYHELWKTETKADGQQKIKLVTLRNEIPLYKKVLEKIKEQKKGKNFNIEDRLLHSSTSLQEFYKQNPTKLNSKIVTTADLLKKRKYFEHFGDKDYQEEYYRTYKKVCR